MKTLLRCGLVLGMAWGWGANARANLIINGSFEEGDFSAGAASGYITVPSGNSTTVPGWTAVGYGGFEWRTFYTVAGDMTLYQPGSGAKMVNLGLCGGIAQTFATTVGQEYQVTFWQSNPGSPDTGVQALVAGTSQYFCSTAFNAYSHEQNYTAFTFNFIANDSTSTLEFYSSAGDYRGPLLDCVSVEALAPVPEPATYLAGLGLLAMMGAAARRKSA